MTVFHFRPAKRSATPLIIGLAGPTKSGKTLSALRLAVGMADGGKVAMINTEGERGRQYADRFTYVDTDLAAPYSPARYQEAIEAALAIDPAVLIVDSMSHGHDGPGGLLEQHDAELDRMAGDDQRKRMRSTWAAWIKPKHDEGNMVYALLGADCHVVLCFRAKEKLKIIPGQDPVELGWQPIASDRIAYETIFTLVLPPHSKGVPDLDLSDMREPFDTLIPVSVQLSEETGRLLADWAKGSAGTLSPPLAAGGGSSASSPAEQVTVSRLSVEQAADLDQLVATLRDDLGLISNDQLWARIASMRGEDVDAMTNRLGGVPFWTALRDDLTEDEARELSGRLHDYLAEQPAAASANGERG